MVEAAAWGASRVIYSRFTEYSIGVGNYSILLSGNGRRRAERSAVRVL